MVSDPLLAAQVRAVPSGSCPQTPGEGKLYPQDTQNLLHPGFSAFLPLTMEGSYTNILPVLKCKATVHRTQGGSEEPQSECLQSSNLDF